MSWGKTPKLIIFSREESPAKYGSLYEQWIFELSSLQRTYSEVQIKEAILHSVKGVAGIVR